MAQHHRERELHEYVYYIYLDWNEKFVVSYIVLTMEVFLRLGWPVQRHCWRYLVRTFRKL
jgi:hypothetical protein